MRRNTRWTRMRFRLVRLTVKVEWWYWGLVAWLEEQRERQRDRRAAEWLARDPARYGRRPYEGIPNTKEW